MRINTHLVDLQTNSPFVFFKEWLEDGWNSCNFRIECLEAHFHLSFGIFDFMLSSQKIFGALGKLIFVLSAFKINKAKGKGHYLNQKIDFGPGILNGSFSMLKLLSNSLKIFCLSKNFVNFRIVVDVEFLGFGTSDDKRGTEGDTDFVVNIVEPAQVILSGPGQTDFTQLLLVLQYFKKGQIRSILRSFEVLESNLVKPSLIIFASYLVHHFMSFHVVRFN